LDKGRFQVAGGRFQMKLVQSSGLLTIHYCPLPSPLERGDKGGFVLRGDTEGFP